MTKHERLRERYEDALFALLMDEMAAARDQEAEEENARLRLDPAAAVPEEADGRCLKTIRRHQKKETARAAGRFTVKALKRVAMAAGIAAILFTTAFATSETVRASTINLIIEVFETNTEFHFSSSSGSTTPQLDVGWVPDGYTLVAATSYGKTTRYEYRNSNQEFLRIRCQHTSGLTSSVDTENAEIEYLQIHNSEAMLIKKGTEHQLVWAAEDNSLFLGVVGENISRDEIVRIANALQYGL